MIRPEISTGFRRDITAMCLDVCFGVKAGTHYPFERPVETAVENSTRLRRPFRRAVQVSRAVPEFEAVLIYEILL